MLRLALQARLPLISVRIDDTANVEKIIRHYAGVADPLKSIDALPSVYGHIPRRSVWYLAPGGGGWPEALMVSHLRAAEASLVVVGQKDGAYDAGSVVAPPALVAEVLEEYLGEDTTREVMPALGGLSITEAIWAVQLAGTKHREITRQAVTDVRGTAFPPHRGLAPVSLDLRGYLPDLRLQEWLAAAGPFFLSSPDERLRPRGLLFNGAPGTGKTMASKFLASELRVPLYRLALEEVKGRFVGESEQALAQALAQADAAEPCVLLIDEVEKLFADQNDSGVTANLLATMLWWLQGHRSRVLTAMTTNDIDKIPAELWRPGRVDEAMSFRRLSGGDAFHLARTIAKTYGAEIRLNPIQRRLNEEFKGVAFLSHADVAKIVVEEIRKVALANREAARARITIQRPREE